MTPEAEIARLARRLRDDPRSLAFVALADVLRRAGRHGEGMQVLREGFRVHPEHSPAKVVLARIHVDMGNRAPAIEVLREVVTADAENLAAASLLARLLADDGRAGEAAPLMERLRMANHPDAGRPELQVEPAADTVAPLELAPLGADPFDHPGLADRFAARGEYGRAHAMWARLRAENPHSTLASARLAAIERTIAGLGDAPGEPPSGEVSRRPLPGRLAVVTALIEEERQRPPPRAHGPLGRWGRTFWGET